MRTIQRCCLQKLLGPLHRRHALATVAAIRQASASLQHATRMELMQPVPFMCMPDRAFTAGANARLRAREVSVIATPHAPFLRRHDAQTLSHDAHTHVTHATHVLALLGRAAHRTVAMHACMARSLQCSLQCWWGHDERAMFVVRVVRRFKMGGEVNYVNVEKRSVDVGSRSCDA